MSNILLACVLLLIGSNLASAAERPNIVLIVSDDHAWTDYGFMGHPHVRTPHLDRLASQSRTFTRGYVPASLCCPSLASIITGLYPHQHKVTSNDPPLPPGVPRRGFQQSAAFQAGRDVMNAHLAGVPTMPRVLGRQGYLSLQTGKWWQGHYRHGGFTHGMTQGGRHGDEGLDIGRKSIEPIVDFIDVARADSKPFFVWYAPLMPHSPHTPPERLLAKYAEQAPSEHMARYWAMIEWFDETVGRLLDHLEQRGLAENTVVLYVADNGWIQQIDDPRYAPKSKQSQYDGGLRSPIMVRWPGKVKPEVRSDLAISIDLMPTVLHLVGESPTPDMQGINLLDDAALADRCTIYGECFTHDAVDLNRPAANLRWRWLIDGDDKLIVPDPTNEPREVVELYQLTADPHEEKNLAAEEPQRVEALRAKLDAWWNPNCQAGSVD
ncbi:MAG: sulfatase [Pirellulales bacterium]